MGINTKVIFLCAGLVLALAGLFAATYKNQQRHERGQKSERGSPGPDAGAEYRKLLSRFNAPDSGMSLSGTIRIYDEENGGRLKEESRFRYMRKGAQWYTQLSWLETFSDGNLTIRLDTVNKYIYLSRPGKSDLSGDIQGGNAFPVFSDTARFGMRGIVTQVGSERLLRLESDLDPGIRSVRLRYDTLTYRIKQAEIESWKALPAQGEENANKIWRSRIDYVYQPFTGVNAEMRIRSVVVQENGRWSLRPLYKNYRVQSGL